MLNNKSTSIEIEEFCCFDRIEMAIRIRKKFIDETRCRYPDAEVEGSNGLFEQYKKIANEFTNLIIKESYFLSKLRDGNGE